MQSNNSFCNFYFSFYKYKIHGDPFYSQAQFLICCHEDAVRNSKIEIQQKSAGHVVDLAEISISVRLLKETT